jgi:hypothetical protein
MQDWILVLPDSIGVIGEQPEIWWQKTRPKEERGRINLPCSNVCFGSTSAGHDRQKSADLLKKSAMFSAAEKYASEIEIFSFGRDYWIQISRSSVQNRRFNQSMTRPFGRNDFFNSIGQKQPLTSGCLFPPDLCNLRKNEGSFWKINARSEF